MSRRLSVWAPTAIWALFIFSLSTDSMSADRTPSLYDCGFDSFGAAIGLIGAAFFSAAREGRS